MNHHLAQESHLVGSFALLQRLFLRQTVLDPLLLRRMSELPCLVLSAGQPHRLHNRC
ncbi:Uncharacterised protein [Vibrio cholerae]|nr:Uncharacterised protein [Vibrio cholerae]